MKRRIWIGIILIIMILGVYKLYSWNSNKNLMEKTNEQLKSLVEPFKMQDDYSPNTEYYMHIEFNNNVHNITLSKTVAYTDPPNAVFKGENFVREIVDILEENL